jgi:hypothetical protein
VAQREGLAESTRALYDWDVLGRRYESLYKGLK